MKKITALLIKKTALLFFILFSIFFLLNNSSARNGEKEKSEHFIALRNVDDAVNDEMAKQEIVGCAVAVIENGEIVHLNAYGHTSPSRNEIISVNSLFRWASVSKPLTAVAAFKVIENGKLSLNDFVKDKVHYWPSDSDKGRITVANLLNHRSGIIRYDNGFFNPFVYTYSNDFNAEQSVNVFKGTGLLFTPGSQHSYTTFGYNLLGAVIEEASGIPYEKFVLDSIASVLGMPSLVPYSNDPGGWSKDCNGYLKAKAEPLSVEYKLPGGGWASNIQDMGKFVKGLINGSFLRNTSALWSTVNNNSGHAFGLVRPRRVDGELYVFHNGSHEDVRTYIGFFPDSESKLGVAVMINGGESIDVNRFARRIEEAMGKNRGGIATQNPVNYCGDNTDCGTTTVGIWRKTNNTANNIIRRGYTNDNFREEWRRLTGQGYECIDIETHMDGLNRLWDGIFMKTGKQTQIWRNAGSDNFLEKWNELTDEGYRLTDIETYMDGNTRKWAGLFVKANGRQVLQRNMSRETLYSKWETLGAEGMKLIDIEYNDGKWVGVWSPGERNSYFTNYTIKQFRAKRLELRENGRKMIDVETYMVGNQRMWAGIWERSTQNERYVYGKKYCEFLTNYHSVNQTGGYELIDFEIY
jgi:CubicO group peptidase (beta-lactamase class C family)